MAFFAQNSRLQGLFLFVLAFLLYANTLTHGFVLDDGIVITENKAVRAGVAGIGDLLTKDSFFGFSGSSEAAHIVAGARYRPLSLLLFAVLYQLFGAQPFVFHLVTVLLYAGVVCLLYRTLLRLLQPVFLESSPLVAFATSLLFAVHPVHTEVVANVKSCDELLALGGGLLALYAALRAIDTPARKWSVGTGVFFFAACLGKENAITFLAVIPLALAWGRSKEVLWKGHIMWALAVSALLFLLLRSAVTGGFSAGSAPAELLNNPYLKQVNGQWVPFSTGEKTAAIFYALGKYLQLLVFPHPLTHDYYPKYIDRLTWGHPLVLLSLLVHVGLAAFVLAGGRRFRLIRFGAAWYLITMSVVSNLFFPIGTHLNERFLFMPSVGFCLFVVGSIWMLQEKFFRKTVPQTVVREKTKTPKNTETAPGTAAKWPSGMLMALGLIAVLWGGKTVLRNPVWASDERLVLTDVKVSANSARANDAAAGVQFNRSLKEKDGAKKQELWRSAIQYADKALTLYPDMASAHATAAKSHHFLGNYDTAIEHYRAAIRLLPDRPEYRRNLAMSLRDGGQFYGEQRNDLTTARRYLAESWQLSAQDPVTAWLTGVTYGVQGDHRQAAEWYNRALTLSPDNPTYLYDLGTALRQEGDVTKGVDLQQKALQINPRLLEERR
jgi:tetratricopeptide (TPR) repeat protein